MSLNESQLSNLNGKTGFYRVKTREMFPKSCWTCDGGFEKLGILGLSNWKNHLLETGIKHSVKTLKWTDFRKRIKDAVFLEKKLNFYDCFFLNEEINPERYQKPNCPIDFWIRKRVTEVFVCFL